MNEDNYVENIDSMIPGVSIQSNIPQIAQTLFGQPPSQPFTVGLELESPDIEHRTPEEAQTVFEVLAHILLYGVRVKYGEQQDPRRLTESQLEEINKYLRSFGFNMVLNTYEMEIQMDNPEDYTPNDIEYYRLRMIDSERGVWHDIKIEPYKYAPLIPDERTNKLL